MAALALVLAVGAVAACSSTATCAQFCQHYYGCGLSGFLGSSSEADCELRCSIEADAGTCQSYGTVLGCLNGLSCSQLDVSTPDASFDNLGRYRVCDIRGNCSYDGG